MTVCRTASAAENHFLPCVYDLHLREVTSGANKLFRYVIFDMCISYIIKKKITCLLCGKGEEKEEEKKAGGKMVINPAGGGRCGIKKEAPRSELVCCANV